MRHIYFSVQEILIMILKKDLVHAHGRKLYKYNEDPSNCTIEVGLKEMFFKKAWCFCMLEVHTNILTTILHLTIIELTKNLKNCTDIYLQTWCILFYYSFINFIYLFYGILELTHVVFRYFRISVFELFFLGMHRASFTYVRNFVKRLCFV